MESRFQPPNGDAVRQDCGLFNCELKVLTYYRLSRLFTDLGFSHRAITFLEMVRRSLSLRQGVFIYFDILHLFLTLLLSYPIFAHYYFKISPFFLVLSMLGSYLSFSLSLSFVPFPQIVLTAIGESIRRLGETA